jgi:hypothetical protein
VCSPLVGCAVAGIRSCCTKGASSAADSCMRGIECITASMQALLQVCVTLNCPHAEVALQTSGDNCLGWKMNVSVSQNSSCMLSCKCFVVQLGRVWYNRVSRCKLVQVIPTCITLAPACIIKSMSLVLQELHAAASGARLRSVGCLASHQIVYFGSGCRATKEVK